MSRVGFKERGPGDWVSGWHVLTQTHFVRCAATQKAVQDKQCIETSDKNGRRILLSAENAAFRPSARLLLPASEAHCFLDRTEASRHAPFKQGRGARSQELLGAFILVDSGLRQHSS